MSKVRLRLTSRGWYWFWMNWLHDNGAVSEIIVGPHPTPERAYYAALESSRITKNNP